MTTDIAEKTTTSLPEVLTARQAAQLLQMSVDTLKSHAAGGMIPAAKVGREWRFSHRQLLAWIEAGGYLSEELVERGIEAVVADRLAQDADQPSIPWEQIEAELGL
jgi:excisionase family DNA binding protein